MMTTRPPSTLSRRGEPSWTSLDLEEAATRGGLRG
jgi:hypothetical protein